MLSTKISDTPGTIENFKDIFNDFSFHNDVNQYKNLLKDILKADIGGILDKINPDPEQIATALIDIANMFNLIKTIKPYLKSPVNQNSSYTSLLKLLQDVIYNDVEDDVMRSFGIWIYDLNEEPATLSYAKEINKNFQTLISFLEESSRIALIIKKGDFSC